MTVSNPTTNPETGLATSAKQDTAKTVLDNIKLGTDKIIASPATEAKQDTAITELQKMTGMEISAHDYIAYTYVSGGVADKEIETVVYRQGGSGGTIVATKTFAYNGDGAIESITKT